MNSSHLSIHHLIADSCSRYPNKIAVEDGKEQITYRELDHASSRFAARLVEKGVEPGQPVPVLSTLCIPLIIGILGILKTGAVYVPIDRSQWSEDHIASVLQSVNGGLLVYTGAKRCWEGYDAVEATTAKDNVSGDADMWIGNSGSTELACIIFTSGTTGKPKGVMIRYEALANFVLSRRSNVNLGPGDRFLLILSVAFDACNGYMLSVLCSGGTLVLATPCNFQTRLHTCTIVAATPSILGSLEPPCAGGDNYPNLKSIILGGETASQRLLSAWNSPAWTIYNDYGPTEATCAVLTGAIELSKDRNSFYNSILGAPISGAQVILLDKHLCEISEPGEGEGEIAISGVCLAKGYWKDQVGTCEKFICWKGRRVYRTGDYGRWRLNSSGQKVVEFRGRRDRVVKNRGFLVNLEADVDAAILEAGLYIAAAYSVVHAGRLYAVVVPRTVDVEVLRERLSIRLAGYQVPDHIVAVDALPKGANGKISSDSIHKIIAALLALDGEEVDMDKTVESIVRSGMACILGLPTATIQLDSDFVRLGGHSLAAVALASHCRRRGALITTYDILTSQTVSDLVARARVCPGKPAAYLEPGTTVETGPITDTQLSFIHGSDSVPGTNVIQATTVYPAEVIPSLMKAWKAVIEAEPIFRTTFDVARRQQTVHTEAAFVWEEVIVDTEDAYERELHNVPFNIGVATRFKVVTWDYQQSALIWTIHHALIDGYSASLILNKVQAVAASGSPVKPGPSFVQLARELELLQKTSEAEAKAFWKQQEEELPNATGQIVLPRPSDAKAAIRLTEVRLATGLSLESITRSMKMLGVTSSVLFYAAWAILLSNYTNSEQVVMGAVVSGRDLPLTSVDTAIGPLVNALPLRIRVDPGSTAADFQRSVFLKLHQIGRFQWSSGERTRYSSMLATQYDMPAMDYKFAAPIKPPTVRECADIPISVLIEEDMSIRFLYHSNHYNKLDIERISENYCNILHALLIPGVDVDTCSRKMLSPAARHNLLSIGNAFSPATFATESSETVVSMFEDIAKGNSQVIAVEKGTSSLTYQELDTAATRLARVLSCYVQVGDVVCLHADHSVNWVIGILGILKAGATYCPLDEIQPAEIRADIYTRSRAALFLTPSHHQFKYAPETASRYLAVDLSLRAEDAENWHWEPVPGDPRAVAYICFTSGSTGKPKGVLCEHDGLMAVQKGWKKISGSFPGQRFAQFMSAGFDGCISEIFGALCHGLTLVLRDSENPFAVLQVVDQAMITPSTAESLDPCNYQNLSRVFLGGEAVSESIVNRWAPGRLLYNYYGPTEGTIISATKRLYSGSAITVGLPIPSMRVYILNDKMDFMPVGVVGEIFIAGVQVARGYIGMEEETKQAFSRDTICPRTSERMYRTGDLGYWTEDGEVMCMGRKDRQVKLRGFRVDLDSVESIIVREVTGITAAAVTVSNGSLIAWVQPACTDVDALTNRLASILPPYARPKAIITVDSFPLSKNGKLDYTAIVNNMRPPILRKRKRESPSGRTESIIAQEWHSLLEFEESETISSDDNFVELGGHSVLQLVLAARLSQLFGSSIPVSTVINSHSLRDLACAVDGLIQNGDNDIKRMEDGRQLGYDDLSPVEVDWWLKYSSAEVTSTFNVPFACNLSRSVDRTLLARAWNVVISRHRLLHCRFVAVDGKPRRVFSDKAPIASLLEKLDIWMEVNRPINLAMDDLIRVLIGPRKMVVVVSHIICDLTALNVLLKEVAAVYAHSSLPPVKTTYMEVSMWSKRASAIDLEFWSTYLRGGPQKVAHPSLQTSLPHNLYHGKSYRGTSRVFDVGQALYQKTMAVAKRHGTTLHQLSRTAVVLVLQSLTETTDIVIGSPFMNRSCVEDQEVVGLFLEPIPMRFRFDGEEDIPCTSIVNAIQRSSQSALAHVVPWNDLLKHLGAEGPRPIFDTVVTFHDEVIGGKQFSVPGVEPFMVWTEGSKFKLLFEWTALSSSGSLIVRLEYDTDRLSAGCIEIVEETLRKCLVCLASDMSYGEIRREILDVSREMCKARDMDVNCLTSLVYGG